MPDRSRPAPFSLRLTPDERSRLEREASGLALGTYIHWRLAKPGTPLPNRRGQAPVKDHAALSSLLAKVGQSRIPNNLNQLAKAAHSGSLILTPDLEAQLREAVAHVAELRRLLVAALGLSDGAS